MAALISLKNITYIKNGFKILDDVSLDFNANELVTIIGPNGSGKTTLLKLIIGSLKANKGKIKKNKKLKIGYVPQAINISKYLPIKVIDFLKLNKLSIDQEIIDLVEIAHLLDKNFYSLSGGELQKVLLARSLMIKPGLLILDEPDQNLDIIAQKKFFSILEKIHKKYKMAILIVSHNLHMVMSKTSKVHCLYNHICCSGVPEQVKLDPKFNEIFGGSFAFYEHKHDHKH